MRHLPLLALLLAAPLAAADPRFSCGGSLEREVWKMWDGSMREHLEQHLLRERLVEQGDVFALYDFQALSHNLVSMARRCGRLERLRDIAGVIGIAYRELEGTPAFVDGRGWRCRGGRLCSASSRLLGKEVKLNSLQFLAVAGAVANALATSASKPSASDRAFIAETQKVLREHLWRWSDEDAQRKIRDAIAARPEDVTGTSSKLFFTDLHLWLLAAHAELAGIQQAGREKKDMEVHARLREHLLLLLEFFSARVTYRPGPRERIGKENMADLDRGYWRLYPENRFAGYEGTISPVACRDDRGDDTQKSRMEVLLPVDAVKPRDDTGWDLSHARRLVHALDALERNRAALRRQYRLAEERLPSPKLAPAFADNLLGAVWNGDRERPLFSNYWSGANGWYRVAYRGVTGKCREGEPPYGLTTSFLTGGYISWARYRPEIGRLGRTLYTLIQDHDEMNASFVRKYYGPMLSARSHGKSHLLRFAFYPSLIGVTPE